MSRPDLIGLLPAYFKVILDFQALMDTEEIELSQFEEYLQRVYDNLFIQTADAATIAYHESLFNIVATSSESMEYRRLRVINRYNNVTPLTMVALRERLNALVGYENYDIDMDYPNYALSVIVRNASSTIVYEILNMLILMVPAHIELNVVAVTEVPSTSISLGIKAVSGGSIMISPSGPIMGP